MGTSKSLGAGSGGAWSQLKGQLTGHFNRSRSVPIRGLVGDAVRAVGGIGVGGRGTGGGGGGARGSGVGGAIGPVVGGLGGFGAAVRDQGLAVGLDRLGLQDLVGKSAVEVVSAVADHLASAVDGLDGELMKAALSEAILEAAQLGDSDGFIDLEKGLQAFLNESGVEGLVEVFLCQFVFDAIWANIEGYVQSKAPDERATQAFMSAIEGVCVAEVRAVIDDARGRGDFGRTDWFGTDGQRIGRQVFQTIDTRLRAMEGE
ncbi:MAG: hypothetical protein ACYCWW_08695 [Deltaproteobacteria bacterium]